jgi:hypothetical protein
MAKLPVNAKMAKNGQKSLKKWPKMAKNGQTACQSQMCLQTPFARLLPLWRSDFMGPCMLRAPWVISRDNWTLFSGAQKHVLGRIGRYGHQT